MITERGVLKSVVDLAISWYGFISFCFICFEAILKYLELLYFLVNGVFYYYEETVFLPLNPFCSVVSYILYEVEPPPEASSFPGVVSRSAFIFKFLYIKFFFYLFYCGKIHRT